MKRHRVYCFGPYQLDAAAKVLLKDGQPVHLTRKAVETLLVLVESAGQVVTKEEIFAAVWPDRVVDEANLAQNIAVIRKALAAPKGEPGYIETFPGRGYRLLGPVALSEAEPAQRETAPPAAVPQVRPRRMLWPMAIVGLASMAALVWWLQRSRSGPEEEPVLHRVPVARQAGKEYQPAVSSDGSKVAYVWEKPEGGATSIWLRESAEGPARRISAEDAEACSPAWSPDGRRLAFLIFRGSTGALVAKELSSGDERILCPVFPSRYGLAHRHLDWSPDGEWLAVDDAESMHEAFGIFLVSARTGQRRRLTKTENIHIGDMDPRFSPDGRHISFIRAFHRAHQELFVVPFNGGNPRQLTFDGKQISGQDWSPDGSTLLFGSDRTGEFRVWKLCDWTKTGRQPVPTGVYGDFPIQLALARKAPVLVYSVLQQDLNVWRLDLAPTGPGERWRRIIASPGQDASPQYSPDGRHICFRSDRSGEEQLWVSDADGNNPVQVTRGTLWPSVGRWAPDSRALVFNNARSGEIYVARQAADGRWEVHSTGATGYH
ncbi:MAG: winged helix-turn-helix transcriptional regulator, partial [Bryobacteraceae bacterium]